MRSRLLALILVPLVACGEAAAQPAAADHVVLDEFSIVSDAEVWEAGAITLTVENAGQRDHTLIVSHADGHVVAATELVGPGEVVAFDVELPSGTYQLTCRIVVEGGDGRLFDHFEQGMRSTIVVTDA